MRSSIEFDTRALTKLSVKIDLRGSFRDTNPVTTGVLHPYLPKTRNSKPETQINPNK